VAQALRRGDLGQARRTLAGLQPQAGEEDLRGFERRHFWSESHLVKIGHFAAL